MSRTSIKPLPEETSIMARRCVNQVTTRSRALGMRAGASSEEVLVSEMILLGQFQNLWQHSAAVAPEHALAAAVLSEGLNDLKRYRFAKRRRGQRLYWEAYAWVAADDRTWPFSFVNICESIGVAVEPVRNEAFAIASPTRGQDVVPEAVVENAA